MKSKLRNEGEIVACVCVCVTVVIFLMDCITLDGATTQKIKVSITAKVPQTATPAHAQ